MLPAGVQLKLMALDSHCTSPGKGNMEGNMGCSWNTIALWLHIFVTRGPGQMVEFKGTRGLVFPQAALKLYTEVSIQLTSKPQSQPLASLLTPSPAADARQGEKLAPVSLFMQYAFELGLNEGEKHPSFHNSTNITHQDRSRIVPQRS